ncbi:hypothetical protein ACFXOD_28690 [Streptomyces sp. NPDC059161]|uniref:hypothetical protein n=1 Tax=Streptomyces sp. NPDC059161 TaxID=3346749 RepID=UPI0036AEB1D3
MGFVPQIFFQCPAGKPAKAAMQRRSLAGPVVGEHVVAAAQRGRGDDVGLFQGGVEAAGEDDRGARGAGVLAFLSCIELGDLLLSCGKAGGETFNCAEPTFAFSISDPMGEVVANLDEPRPLGRRNDEERATDTCFSEL